MNLSKKTGFIAFGVLYAVGMGTPVAAIADAAICAAPSTGGVAAVAPTARAIDASAITHTAILRFPR